jgi:hypothetical protein
VRLVRLIDRRGSLIGIVDDVRAASPGCALPSMVDEIVVWAIAARLRGCGLGLGVDHG